MCGRFTLRASPEAVARALELDEIPELAPRYNIAPGQDVASVTAEPGGRRRLALRRWGLVPGWAKDPALGSRLVNARAETAHEKPAFREAFRRRRCAVPADGFYEWAPAGRGMRQPYWIARPDGGCFAIAGLFERWCSPDGAWLESLALITTEANERLASLHPRMPAVLAREDLARWLDPALEDPARLAPLLRPLPAAALVPTPVSARVNRVANDDPALIAAETPAQGALF